jgi:hypothetical protein
VTAWLLVLAAAAAASTLMAAIYLRLVQPLIAYWWQHRRGADA